MPPGLRSTAVRRRTRTSCCASTSGRSTAPDPVRQKPFRRPRECTTAAPGSLPAGYASSMAKKLVIKVTAGADAPERCSQAFTVAAVAVASGVDVSLWLTGEAAWVALPGRAAEVELPHAAPPPGPLGSPPPGGRGPPGP